MNQASHTLSEAIRSIAEKSGAVLIGTTKVYHVETTIVFGTPLNENWHLSYLFSEAERLREERRITKVLLGNVGHALKDEGFHVEPKTSLSFFGDLRPLAVAAGLGHYGRNGLVINKDYSSGLVLSAIFTDAPVEIKEQAESLDCAECGLCVRLCPAHALSDGMLNYKKCLPYALRGCAQCLKACGYAKGEKV